MYSMWLHVLQVGMCDGTVPCQQTCLYYYSLRTVMDRERPPSRGGLVLSGLVPFLTVPDPGQYTPEPEWFQNRSGP